MSAIRELYKHGEIEVSNVCAGDLDALKTLFEKRTRTWNQPLMSWGVTTVGLFGDLEEKIAPETAFELVVPACKIAHAQVEESLFSCGIWLVLGIVNATGTTEVPSNFVETFQPVKARALISENRHILLASKSISEHYRSAV